MTTTPPGRPDARRGIRRAVAGSLATAVAATGLTALGVVAAAPAQAAPKSVTGAALTWDFNNEVNAGAFAPGTWNLMSAGKVGDPGAGGATLKTADSGATWSTGAAAGWTNTAGNVTIEDKQADGTYAPTTFLGTRQNTAGQNTSGSSNTILAETRMVLSNGTGTLDPETDDATLTWDGDATVLFYSGMTFFYVSDPVLTLDGGAGELTATVSGFATSQDDATQWDPVAPEQVTLATVSGVDVTSTGLTATPAYREVTYTPGTGQVAQLRSGPSWGSFPQDFVDFQQVLGQGPYWYSSGGAADARKVANPFTVDYGPRVTVSARTFSATGSTQVTVTGTGFDPALATGTRPPLAGRPAGAYVVFGKFAQNWKPSAGALGATRVNSSQKWAVLAEDAATVGGEAAGAVTLSPAGGFTATLTVDKAAIDAKATAADLVNYGIYTYAGAGVTTTPAYETYTPVNFTKVTPSVSVTAPKVTYGAAATATVKLTGGDTGKVTLTRGTTTVGTADLAAGTATFALGKLGAGSYPLTASYAGTDAVDAGTGTATLVVAKAGTTTKVKVTKKPKPKKAGKATATVTSPSGAVAGATKVVLKNAKGKTVKGVKAGKVKNGKATVKLPKLTKGKYTLVVTFTGDANLGSSKKKLTIKV